MVDVRPARTDDVTAVWPLARDFATSYRPERAVFDRTFAQLVGSDDALLAVATSDGAPGHVVGYLLATTHLTFLANGPVCWVEELMVDVAHRRTGVGAALLVHAERWAQRQGCAYVSLASRRAGDFYRRQGYDESAVYFRRTLTD